MSLIDNKSCDEKEGANRFTKKVRIKGKEDDKDVAMEAEPATERVRPWKDMLMGTGLMAEERSSIVEVCQEDDNFEIK